MSTADTTTWIGAGLPLYGALTFWASLVPSPTRALATRPGRARWPTVWRGRSASFPHRETRMNHH
jgi:hypothetical protein